MDDIDIRGWLTTGNATISATNPVGVIFNRRVTITPEQNMRFTAGDDVDFVVVAPPAQVTVSPGVSARILTALTGGFFVAI